MLSRAVNLSPRKKIVIPLSVCSVKHCMHCLSLTKETILFPFREHGGTGTIYNQIIT